MSRDEDRVRNARERLDEIITAYGRNESELTASDIGGTPTARAEAPLTTVQVTAVKPYEPGEGVNEDVVFGEIRDGIQFSHTEKSRPICPSCRRTVANPGELNDLLGACRKCETKTCAHCIRRCEACGTILCYKCPAGNGLENRTYCDDCVTDIKEEIQYRREEDQLQRQHQRLLDEERLQQKQREFEERKESNQHARYIQEFVQALSAQKQREDVKDKKENTAWTQEKEQWQEQRRDAEARLKEYDWVWNVAQELNKDRSAEQVRDALDRTSEPPFYLRSVPSKTENTLLEEASND